VLGIPFFIVLGWSVLLTIGLILLALENKRLTERFEATIAGTKGQTIEQTVKHYYKRIDEVGDHNREIATELERVGQQINYASQKIAIVRFNPFGDIGGEQSFALTVLDDQDTGYILTSMHGREGTRIYAKPVDYGEAKYPLSKEEQQSLGQAKKRKSSRKKAKQES
jgi:hypothetical protein